MLKFYIWGTHHVISRIRNDDSAHQDWCWISRKPLETDFGTKDHQ